MDENQGPRNRLDAALDRLEEVVRSRIEQPMRHLRQVISRKREQGGFDEARYAEEVEKIAFRDRQTQTRKPLAVEEEIEMLAIRLEREKP